MKVVALISGGKDSSYAMMKCIQFGHQIVALANLMPVDESIDELDSHMFQTVGHQMVVCYAECMGLPLFRRRIRGSQRHENLTYSVTSGDEVEDLFVLLSEVKRQMPSVTAVSSGAIASDYQRLRVESACSRLGLVSLAYLWKQDQTLLLHEMIMNGISAILVKVACIGLEPTRHLGKDISCLESHLHKLNELYGVNVCGEGGEYETLTLDCPLFCNARIVLEKFELVFHSSGSIAPVAVIHPLEFHLEAKEKSVLSHNNDGIFPRTIIEVEGDSLIPSFKNKDNSDVPDCCNIITNKPPKTSKNIFSVCSWLDNPSTSSGLAEDLTLVLSRLEFQLLELGFYWKDVVYIHMYIADMNDFVKANDIYIKFVTQEKCPFGVPSRSTVELPLLQAGCGTAYVEALVTNDERKNVLHVQSISSWAPSCIGPYSQATLHKEILHMAGQLGLDPSTMSVEGFTPAMELENAFQNCEAVANHYKSSLSTSAFLFTIYCSKRVPLSFRSHIQFQVSAFVEKLGHSYPPRKPKIASPMFLYVLVSDLPKRAAVEVKPLLFVPTQSEVVHNINTSHCSKSQLDGRITTCLINANICAITLSLSTRLASAAVQCDHLSTFCLNHLQEAILESDFSWEHVMNLRIYFPITVDVKLDTLIVSFTRALHNLTSAEPVLSIVPVLAVGGSPAMDDVVTCELLASKS